MRKDKIPHVWKEYHKILKLTTLIMILVFVKKITVWFVSAIMRIKNTEWLVNRGDTGQTGSALIAQIYPSQYVSVLTVFRSFCTLIQSERILFLYPTPFHTHTLVAVYVSFKPYILYTSNYLTIYPSMSTSVRLITLVHLCTDFL